MRVRSRDHYVSAQDSGFLFDDGANALKHRFIGIDQIERDDRYFCFPVIKQKHARLQRITDLLNYAAMTNDVDTAFDVTRCDVDLRDCGFEIGMDGEIAFLVSGIHISFCERARGLSRLNPPSRSSESRT